MERDNKELIKWMPAFIFAVLLIIIYKILDNFLEISYVFNNFIKIISPVLIGILISYLLYIPCRKLEVMYNKSKVRFISKGSRGFSILSVYLLFILIIGIVIKFAIPVLYKNVVELVNNVPTYYSSMIESANNIPEDSILNSFNLQEKIADLSSINLAKYIDIGNIGQYAKGALGILTNLFSIFISIIISVYVLIERRSIVIFLNKLNNSLFKKSTCENVRKYFKKANEVFFIFIGSRVLDSIINWIIATIILLLLDVKYAFLLGILAGVFNLVPYFGSILSTIIIAFITIFTGGLGTALTTLVLLIVFQQIDANIIAPKIMKSSLNISPILVILSIMVGGAYFGVLGMFLAVPVITVLKTILLDYIEFKQKQKVS